MLKGGVSDPRNKNVLKMFNLIGIGERVGSGALDIFEVWREEKMSKEAAAKRLGISRTTLWRMLKSSSGTDK